MKLHITDIRFKNNMGIEYPVCQRMKAGPLDMDVTHYPMINSDQYRAITDKTKVCKHCIRAWAKLYGDWAPLDR